MKPGIYEAAVLSNQAYHSADGVSNSGLKLIGQKSPLHFWGQYLAENRPPRKETNAMLIGTAIHAAALEPDKFADEYVVADFKARNSAGFKSWAAQQTKNIILAADYENVLSMRSALYGHPVAASLLSDARAFELSFAAKDPETSLLCKARADLLTNSNWLVDLKKCQDASDIGCAKSIFNYGYYHQDAFYSDVWEWASGSPPAGFAFIFIEEVFPHAISVIVLSDSDRARGRLEYRKNLEIYASCIDSGVWPGYGDSARELNLAPWQRRKIDENLEG